MGQYGEDFKFWSESKDCACQQRPYLAEGRASVALPLRGALQGRHELVQLRGHRLAHDDHPIDGPRQEQMRDLLTQRICFLPLTRILCSAPACEQGPARDQWVPYLQSNAAE